MSTTYLTVSRETEGHTTSEAFGYINTGSLTGAAIGTGSAKRDERRLWRDRCVHRADNQCERARFSPYESVERSASDTGYGQAPSVSCDTLP
jgi:hypothetical protein